FAKSPLCNPHGCWDAFLERGLFQTFLSLAYDFFRILRFPPIPLKPVTTLQPTYPVQAAAKRIEGQVTATFDILDDGRVDNVSLTGCHLFFRETLTAMRHWLYPAGHPAMRQVINFEFSLKNDGLQDPRPVTTQKLNDDGCRQ
ncbi:TonB family protein, partial [Klebsiella pneumoniae]|nr:TonB family protein [Klebsiella pneumoniae]